ncbi:MAG: LPXTG cell wall anchor domain-containing protein [Streptosporangiales bacterium]|nr:LPXTG cell wall anchor domain-containing protein [Streptosporangiales bacterium]
MEKSRVPNTGETSTPAAILAGAAGRKAESS